MVVGTPGRVLDFLEKGHIKPRFVRLLVRACVRAYLTTFIYRKCKYLVGHK